MTALRDKNGQLLEPAKEITLRDYFAACFVKGALSNSTIKITAPGDSASHIAKSAYMFADAMLTEREK
jgi:hypothetical protein